MGFAMCPSDANFLWARHESRPAKEIFQALKAAGILIRYFPGERTGQYIRITIGTDGEIDQLLVELKKWLEG
jgi:histidinol-phosphate aminotransferase